MTAEQTACLVAAAGRGVRFGRETPKAFHPVEGKTLLARSVGRLAASGAIGRFIVMVPEGWEEKGREEASGAAGGVPLTVLAGGETRQESVAAGLAEAGGEGIILVHDAARPFVSASLVERVVEAAIEAGAAVPALQVTDTLGRIRDDRLEAIVPRDRIIGIQTPQAFRAEVITRAFEEAAKSGAVSTDESSLVLAAGMHVRVVEGERWNIKITVRDDLDIAASLIAGGDFEAGGKQR